MMSTLLLLCSLAMGAALSPGVQRVLDEASAEGLPASLFVDLAQQGAAKRVPEERIVVALEGLRADLRAARAVLGGSATPDELAAAVVALKAGVQPDTLKRFAQTPDPAVRVASMAGLGDLVRAGFLEEDAALLVGAAVRSRDPQTALRGLPIAARSLLDQGMSRGLALRRLEGEVAAGRSALGIIGVRLPSESDGGVSREAPGRGKGNGNAGGTGAGSGGGNSNGNGTGNSNGNGTGNGGGNSNGNGTGNGGGNSNGNGTGNGGGQPMSGEVR
jgi:hypothetical protein